MQQCYFILVVGKAHTGQVKGHQNACLLCWNLSLWATKQKANRLRAETQCQLFIFSLAPFHTTTLPRQMPNVLYATHLLGRLAPFFHINTKSHENTALSWFPFSLGGATMSKKGQSDHANVMPHFHPLYVNFFNYHPAKKAFCCFFVWQIVTISHDQLATMEMVITP